MILGADMLHYVARHFDEFTSDGEAMTSKPPKGLPRYRLLTGPDDASFCESVSEMLDLGYLLAGGPAIAVGPGGVVAAQAVVWGVSATNAE